MDALTHFVTVNSVPLVNDVGPENYSKYVDSGLPLAYLFVAKDEDREKFGSALESSAKKYRGKVNFVYIDAEQFGGHARNLNLKEEWPAFAIQEIGPGTKFPLDQSSDLTVESLTSFVDDFMAGKVKPSIKSAPIPESNEGPVKVVVADSFEDIVFDKEKDVLMEFYAPWCGHCKVFICRVACCLNYCLVVAIGTHLRKVGNEALVDGQDCHCQDGRHGERLATRRRFHH